MKILLVDEHPLFIDGLRNLLNRHIDGLDIFESSCFDRVVDFFESENFDLILTNHKLPNAAGTDLLKAYLERDLRSPIAVLTNDDDALIAKSLLDMGACGFIPKSLPLDEVVSAVKVVLEGKQFLTESTRREIDLLTQWQLSERPNMLPMRASIVTERQLDVIQLLAKGYTNKRISRILNLSIDTVKEHITNIFFRLDVSNRTLCVVRARELGIDIQY